MDKWALEGTVFDVDDIIAGSPNIRRRSARDAGRGGRGKEKGESDLVCWIGAGITSHVALK